MKGHPCAWHPKNNRTIEENMIYGDLQTKNGWEERVCPDCGFPFWPWEFGEKVKNEREILNSAIELIKNIRHGNIYKDPVDAAANFLIEHGYEKL